MSAVPGWTSRPRLDYESHATGLDRNELGALLVAAGLGPHTLCHAFMTAAPDAGVTLRDVQEAGSHADPRTTMAAAGRDCGAGP